VEREPGQFERLTVVQRLSIDVLAKEFNVEKTLVNALAEHIMLATVKE
jgi:hypothetical protein